jgi:hypothetical protein
VLKTKRPKPVSPKSFSPQKPPSRSLDLLPQLRRRRAPSHAAPALSNSIASFPLKNLPLSISPSPPSTPPSTVSISGRSSPSHRRRAPSSVVQSPRPAPSHSVISVLFFFRRKFISFFRSKLIKVSRTVRNFHEYAETMPLSRSFYISLDWRYLIGLHYLTCYFKPGF